MGFFDRFKNSDKSGKKVTKDSQGSTFSAAHTSPANVETPVSWGAVPGTQPVQPQAPAVEGQVKPAVSPLVPEGGIQFLQGQQAVELLQSLGLGSLAAGAGNISVNITTDASVADLQRAQQAGAITPGSQLQYFSSTGSEEEKKVQEIIDQADYGVLASGETAESTILEVKDLGVRVAGNNPAVKMLIEVQPHGREAFRAEVVGFVNEASMHKLQVGSKLTVKYDPADTTRVSICHTGPEEGPEGLNVVE